MQLFESVRGLTISSFNFWKFTLILIRHSLINMRQTWKWMELTSRP